MKTYLAGTSVSNPADEKRLQTLFQAGHKLHSYYHCKDGFEKNWFIMNTKNKVELFLDSGAFSAWTQKIEINIDDYIEFIKQHKDVIDVYANLDVIGIGGKQPNQLTAKRTLENQKIMEAAGLSPLPCFHFGEPTRYLKRYIRDYNYIALGVAGNVGRKLIPWLNDCFSKYICDEKGFPKVKIHGFAVTSLPLMLRYPWYSVDSTSWVVTGRMGSVYIPRYRSGKWIYDENSWKIAVSNRSPNTKEAGKHIETLPPTEKQIALDYIHNKGYQLGKSEFKKVDQTHKLEDNERWADKKPKSKTVKRELEIMIEPGISNKYQLRDEMNIIYFLDLEKSMPEWPWVFKMKGQDGLF